MMGQFWFWRTSWSMRLGPVVGLAGALVALANAKHVQPYWLDVSSKATVSVLLLAPGFAALGALDASRLRRGRIRGHDSRASIVTLGGLVLPAMLTTAVTLLALVVAIAIRANVSFGVPNIGLLLLTLLSVTAFGLVGIAIGDRMSLALAVPLAFAVAWLWLVFPPTITPFWIRNVNGNIGTSCCSLNQQLVSGALVAPAVVTSAIVLLAAVAISRPRGGLMRIVAAAVSLGAVVGCVAVGRSLMLDVGPDPVEARVGGTTCEGSAPRVCLWPEYEKVRPQLAAVVRDVYERQRKAGLATPDVATTSAEVPASWLIDVNPADDATWRAHLNLAPLVGLPPACLSASRGQWPAGANFGPVQLWLLHVGGSDIPPTAAAGDLGVLHEIERLPAGAQVAWYEGNVRALRTCTEAPVAPAP